MAIYAARCQRFVRERLLAFGAEACEAQVEVGTAGELLFARGGASEGGDLRVEAGDGVEREEAVRSGVR